MVLVKFMAQPVFIQLVNVGLDNWGSKQWMAPEFPIVAGESPLSSLHWLRTEFASFDTQFRTRSVGAEISLGLIVMLFVLLGVGLALQCLGRCDEDDEAGIAKPPKTSTKNEIPGQDVSNIPSASQQNLQFGSWRQAYDEASGPDREALELLYHCQIISVYEFGASRVDRAHIDQCIGIARHMLQQRKLGDWIAIKYRAKELFEANAKDAHDATSQPEVVSSMQSCDSLLDQARPPSPPRSPMTLILTPKSTPMAPMVRPTVPQADVQYHSHALAAGEQLPPLPMPVERNSPHTTPPVRPRVPQINLRPVNESRNQSSDKDDDDPFTTRDYYQG